jgi:microcystin-dependent protein
MINFTQELATSTIAVAPSPATSGTSITLQTGHGSRFPNSFSLPFILIAHPDNELPTEDNAEFLRVTGVSGDSFTIERGMSVGYVSPSPKSISTGWRVSIPVTTEDVSQSLSTFFFVSDSLAEFSIGDVLAYSSPGVYFKAQADTAANAEVVGIVQDREGDICKVVSNGYIQLFHGYGSYDGAVLYLSPDTAGDLTETEPSTPGQVSKPIMIIQSSDGSSYTYGFVNIMRGMEIDEGWGSTSFISDATPAGLVNGSNTAYTVPEAYTAGTMEVFINGLKQIRDTDYTETNPTTGSFTISPAPSTGDVVRVNYMTGAFGTGNSDTVDGYHASQLMTPIGAIMDYGGATAPTGWLLCYGQAVSRTTYAALFAVLGTTYGVGDGSTTFNVPDIRGRVVAGQDDMGGTSSNRLTGTSGSVDGDVLGGTGGAETHTLGAAEMPSHTHTMRNAGTSGGAYGLVDSGSASSSGMLSTGSAGSGSAHNNVQPTIILNKIIRAL